MSIYVGQSGGNEKHQARCSVAGVDCCACNPENNYYNDREKDKIVTKNIPESPELAILPEQVTNILQFARACSLGIITPEELGNKLDDFETWLGEHF